MRVFSLTSPLFLGEEQEDLTKYKNYYYIKREYFYIYSLVIIISFELKSQKQKNSNENAFLFNLNVHEMLMEVCHPLFVCTPIKNVRYMRMFKDYTYFSLGTNLDYTKKYLQTIKAPGKIFEPKKIYSTSLMASTDKNLCFFLWPEQFSKKEKDPLYNLVYEYDVWHGFTISKKSSDYVETWSFTTSRNIEGMHQFYINNLQLLQHFIKHFESKLSPVLNSISHDKLAFFNVPFDLDVRLEDQEDKIKKFFTNTQLIKSSVFCNNIEVKLSLRELECLIYTASGLSMKQIAIKLCISPRTVETFINSIKTKTGLHYKSQLISLIPEDEILLYKNIFFTNKVE